MIVLLGLFTPSTIIPPRLLHFFMNFIIGTLIGPLAIIYFGSSWFSSISDSSWWVGFIHGIHFILHAIGH